MAALGVLCYLDGESPWGLAQQNSVMEAGKRTSGTIVPIRKDSGHTVVQPVAPPSGQLWKVPCPRA